MGRRKGRRHGVALCVLRPPRKLDFLAAFAYNLVLKKGSGTSFTLAKLREIYLLICRRFNLPASDADTVCREIESHTGIIIKATYDTYEFSHKSIQEYLVAEHLVRLRDIPSAIRLLRDCPNELAVAVALSSDPTDFSCGLFRYKGTRVKPKKNEWLIVFLSRLADEKPGLEDNPELGGTCLWLFSRCQEVVLDSRIQPLTNLNRNFHFELPLHPKTYASYPVVSTANSSGLFEVVVRHILAVLRSRCAGFACPACLAADTYPARPLLSTYNYPLSWVASRLAAAVPRSFAACC